jgi:anti-anti-sigma factor
MELIVHRWTDNVAVVRLGGRVDLLTAVEVKHAFARAVAHGQRRLVVDLNDVTFIDSSGLGALIGGLKVARQAGGDLRIARPSDQARVILELTTLNRILKPYPSVEEALAGYV